MIKSEGAADSEGALARLSEIKAKYPEYADPDLIWLVLEVERLRSGISVCTNELIQARAESHKWHTKYHDLILRLEKPTGLQGSDI